MKMREKKKMVSGIKMYGLPQTSSLCFMPICISFYFVVYTKDFFIVLDNKHLALLASNGYLRSEMVFQPSGSLFLYVIATRNLPNGDYHSHFYKLDNSFILEG